MKNTTPNPRRKLVFLANENNAPTCSKVLGGKGAGLAQLVRSGVPVPPAFTVTTSVMRAVKQHGKVPQRLDQQLEWGISALEKQTVKRFGNPEAPLLVSVRSGAAVSMPGMMDTILNLGLNPEVVEAMALKDARFAWDNYRRFLAVYGQIVMGVDKGLFEQPYLAMCAERKAMTFSPEPVAAELKHLCTWYQERILNAVGQSVPNDPREQLRDAQAAVLSSWWSERACAYRKAHRISDSLGTAVNVQAMVFGNRDERSGTGVVFSRNVSTGAPGMWGEFLPMAQGEDVVSGARTPLPITALADWNRRAFQQLTEIVTGLEQQRREVVDVEFTVESGKLFILQVRAGKMTPEAAVTTATHFVWEKIWTKEEALKRVDRQALNALNKPSQFDASELQNKATRRHTQGLPAAPGAVSGVVALTSESAVRLAASGHTVVLVRQDTSPDDLPGMIAASAIVTSNGGMTSHAAVVARNMGKTAVVGCGLLPSFIEGDQLSVDGNTGCVYWGKMRVVKGESKKEANLFTRWLKERDAKRNCVGIRFEMIEETVVVNRLINDFYMADIMDRDAAGSELANAAHSLKQRVHRETAERLATYLVVAVGGELRHARDHYGQSRSAVAALLGEFGIVLGGDRRAAQVATLEKLRVMPHDKHVQFLDLCIEAFDNGSWGGSYGGKKWGQIARAARDFLNGTLPPSVFADHAFDLQHNNGSVFGKNPMLSGDRDSVFKQLEAKKYCSGSSSDLFQALERLCAHRFSAGIVRTYSPEVLSLFSRGVERGVWPAVDDNMRKIVITPPARHKSFTLFGAGGK